MPVVGLVSLRFWSERAAVGLCMIAHDMLLSVSAEVSLVDLCSLFLSLSVPGMSDAGALRRLLWSVCALIESWAFYEFCPICIALCACILDCVWHEHSS